MLRRLSTFAVAAIVALASSAGWAADSATAVDLKRAAPANVHLAVYAKHNSERDYQREYLEEVWKTVQDEEICKRVLKIITSRVPEDKLDKAKAVFRDVKEALEPIDGEALLNAKESVVVQRFEAPFQQTLVAMRLESGEAEKVQKGVAQVFALAAKNHPDKISVEEIEVGDAKATILRLPEKSPYQPAVAQLDDVVLFSTGPKLLRESLNLLQSDAGESKFDDPRLQEALEHLPKPEDALMFFDGARLFKSLHGVSDFIREQKSDDEKAERVAKLFDRIIDELNVIDYEASVQFTEDGENREAAIGKLADDAESKILGKTFMQGQPFDKWQEWIPKEATSYSLGTGANLHELYKGIMEIVREEFPESHAKLDEFEEKQEEIGVNIDRDILQSFSGEYVTVRMKVEGPQGAETVQGVTALRCENPERIGELLERAVDGLSELPALAAQELELVDSEDLDGFKELHANFFKALGASPVIGFKDGWMIVSSHAEAAEKFVAVREGDAATIDQAETLKGFDLEADGEVYAVSYCDVGAGIRQAADWIDKVGAMAPMFVGMIGAKAKPEDLKPLQEAVGLLPSIAKVVRKFDFMEDRLSIVQEGPLPHSYLRTSATHIRQPEGK
jgi:hypothetical protein